MELGLESVDSSTGAMAVTLSFETFSPHLNYFFLKYLNLSSLLPQLVLGFIPLLAHVFEIIL